MSVKHPNKPIQPMPYKLARGNTDSSCSPIIVSKATITNNPSLSTSWTARQIYNSSNGLRSVVKKCPSLSTPSTPLLTSRKSKSPNAAIEMHVHNLSVENSSLTAPRVVLKERKSGKKRESKSSLQLQQSKSETIYSVAKLGLRGEKVDFGFRSGLTSPREFALFPREKDMPKVINFTEELSLSLLDKDPDTVRRRPSQSLPDDCSYQEDVILEDNLTNIKDDSTVQNEIFVTTNDQTLSLNEAMELFNKHCKTAGSQRSSTPGSSVTSESFKSKMSVTLISRGQRQTFRLQRSGDVATKISALTDASTQSSTEQCIESSAFWQPPLDTVDSRYRLFVTFHNNNRRFVSKICTILSREFYILVGDRDANDILSSNTTQKLHVCDALLLCYSKSVDCCRNSISELMMMAELCKPAVVLQLSENINLPRWLMEILGVSSRSFLKVSPRSLEADVGKVKETLKSIIKVDSKWKASESIA